MRKQVITIKEIKDEMNLFILFGTPLLLLPIGSIYLFEDGFWLSISMFFNCLFCGGYFNMTDSILERYSELSNIKDNTIIRRILLCIFLQLLLLTFYIFPFALMSDSFIRLINCIFGLEYNIKYEGGIIVSLLTIVCIIIFVSNIIRLCSIAKKNGMKIKYSFISFIILVVSISSLSIIVIRNSTNHYIIKSQSEIESDELDSKIQQYKIKQYKKYSGGLYE